MQVNGLKVPQKKACRHILRLAAPHLTNRMRRSPGFARRRARQGAFRSHQVAQAALPNLAIRAARSGTHHAPVSAQVAAIHIASVPMCMRGKRAGHTQSCTYVRYTSTDSSEVLSANATTVTHMVSCPPNPARRKAN